MKKITLFEEINRMKTLMNVNVLTESTIPGIKALEKSAEELWNYSKRLLVRGTERNAEETVESVLERLKTMVGSDAEQYLESIGKQIGRVETKQVEKEIIEFLSKNKVAQENIFANLKINFENEIEELITKTAKSPEIRDAWDDVYSQALKYAGGDIEQAQDDLRKILEDELSDKRILEKYFENVEVVEDDLGNWIVKPKRQPDVINVPERTPENGGDGSTPNEPIVPEELEIFDIRTWGELPKLSDKQIKELVNLNIWDNVVRKFESLFNPSRARIKYIQQLASSIENTTNTELQAQLRTKLKKELEWLYKKNTNNFVAMKGYFDKIARTNRGFGQEWESIKSYSNGGWDFYKSFGIMAQDISTFNRVWGGITSDLKVLFEVERKIFGKMFNKLVKTETKTEFIGNFKENFKSGSRRGFPKMSNEKYQKIIELYGPTGAKASYFRDLVVGTLKWNMYTGFFITLRNSVANFSYEDAIQRCISTNNINSKECLEINDSWMDRRMVEWSLKYRENPEDAANFIKSWALETIGIKSNLPEIVESDLFYKKLSEISTIDPGLIGEAANLFFGLFNLNDNPERKKELLAKLDKQIQLGKENAKKAEDKVVEVIENPPVVPNPPVIPNPPTVTYTNDADGLINWLNVNGPFKGKYGPGDKSYIEKNGNIFTFKGTDKTYTHEFKDGTFTQKSAVPINETIKKNNMKRILETKIHNILKKQLNEQRNALPTWVADYPCISQYTLSATGDDNKVYEVSQSGKWYYFKGGKYKREENGVISTGTWKCETGDKLRVRLPSLNTQWTEEKNWHKISNYTKCPETLPIKQWCKNDTIKQVQACLKMPIEYQTGNFGKYTKGYLESRDQSGTTITKDTIINVCGPNHPLSVGLVGTSGSGASGTPNTGASGTPNTGASGTPNTGASGTPDTGASGTPDTGASGTPGANASGTSGQTTSKYDKYRKVRMPEEIN